MACKGRTCSCSPHKYAGQMFSSCTKSGCSVSPLATICDFATCDISSRAIQHGLGNTPDPNVEDLYELMCQFPLISKMSIFCDCLQQLFTLFGTFTSFLQCNCLSQSLWSRIVGQAKPNQLYYDYMQITNGQCHTLCSSSERWQQQQAWCTCHLSRHAVEMI